MDMTTRGPLPPPPPPIHAGSHQLSQSPGPSFKQEDDSMSMSPASTPASGQGGRPIKRRAAIACRRCRRMRSKCVHEKSTPPCRSCQDAGIAAEDCIFPVRGQPDNDREYRHPRMRSDKTSRRDPNRIRRDTLEPSSAPHLARSSVAPLEIRPEDEWDLLPPLPEVVEGINTFTRHYFQLGFIPKQQFPMLLMQAQRDCSVFLLLSILSISARFTAPLAQRYGSGMKAAEMFMDRAAGLAKANVYEQPTLEICQAFYLLSIAQQGNGLRNPSYMNMGIAIRMAAMMQLHREETYVLRDPTPELRMRAESARRTLWMLHSQDNLHSSPRSPVSLTACDITALLPASERDFEEGSEPPARAALEDTPPAMANPSLIASPHRSLFASLIQVHYYWGAIARRAVDKPASRPKKDEPPPWNDNSKYKTMERRLYQWEQGLPNDHKWSLFLLKGYKTERQDLAYLGVTMMTRLCNIIIRREYLENIIKGDSREPENRFFSNMSLQLFENVVSLFEQIDAQFSDRTPDESVGAQMAAFCVYSCGLFSTYLVNYPNICSNQNIMRMGQPMLQRTKSILDECKEVWPLATRWLRSLEKFGNNPKTGSINLEGGMADGHDPVPVALPGAKTLLESALPSPSIKRLPHPDDTKRVFSSASTPASATQTPVLPPPTPSHMGNSHGSFPPPSPHHHHPQSYHAHPHHQQPHPSQSFHRGQDSPYHYQQHHPPYPHYSQSHSHSPHPSHGAPLPHPHPHSHHPLSRPPSTAPTSSAPLLLDTNFSPATPQPGSNNGPEMMYDPSGAYYSPATTTLGPGTDGYDEQLQFYIEGQIEGGDQAWMAGGGPSLYGF